LYAVAAQLLTVIGMTPGFVRSVETVVVYCHRVVKNLETEVSSHRQLRHPNIVQIMAMVYEPMVECGIVLCFEMYGDIGQFLHRFKVLLAWKIEMIRHINLGMNYLHTNQPPIIHGDIKTLNILIGEGFVAKVNFYSVPPYKSIYNPLIAPSQLIKTKAK